MDITLRILLLSHVTLGFIGLVAFWVPILTRKGSPVHRRFGKLYQICAYIVLASASVAVILRTIQYLADGHTPATRPAAFGALLFLAYLALVTFVVVRHGILVLRYKKKPEAMAIPLNIWLARLAMAASLTVITYALVMSPPNKVVLFALSPIGLLTGLGMIRYVSNPPQSSRAWLYEHLGSMIGGGIAFHTAFTVFGVTRIFDIGLDGWIAVIPWIAPAAIGLPASVIWTRHYRRKYGELA